MSRVSLARRLEYRFLYALQALVYLIVKILPMYHRYLLIIDIESDIDKVIGIDKAYIAFDNQKYEEALEITDNLPSRWQNYRNTIYIRNLTQLEIETDLARVEEENEK